MGLKINQRKARVSIYLYFARNFGYNGGANDGFFPAVSFAIPPLLYLSVRM
jgi:hypothetical protein